MFLDCWQQPCGSCGEMLDHYRSRVVMHRKGRSLYLYCILFILYLYCIFIAVFLYCIEGGTLPETKRDYY